MEPQQLAALLGREIDAGFAAALSRLGASRALIVDRIQTRVGALPATEEGATPTWDQIPWAADVTLRPVPPGPGTAPDEPESPAASPLREHLAAQPISAIRGVGAAWEQQLTRWGYPLVGDLATADPGEFIVRGARRIPELLTLLARARTLCNPWPPNLPAGQGRSIADIATTQPGSGDVAAYQLWDHCIGLLAALDLDVATVLRVP